MILLSDPAITRMPVEESGEALLDLRTVQALRVDPRMADANGFHARLRLGVVDRLVTERTRARVQLSRSASAGSTR